MHTTAVGSTVTVKRIELALEGEGSVARVSTNALRGLTPLLAEEAVVTVCALVNAPFGRIAEWCEISTTLLGRTLSVL